MYEFETEDVCVEQGDYKSPKEKCY